ncbi:TPA: hypothetical protein PTV97_003774 [Clostridium botulinum]|nr:hypothetical protein [Clostridium botulinum]
MIKLLNAKVEVRTYGSNPTEYLEDAINQKMKDSNIKDNQVINIEIIRSTEAIIIYKS